MATFEHSGQKMSVEKATPAAVQQHVKQMFYTAACALATLHDKQQNEDPTCNSCDYLTFTIQAMSFIFL